MQELNVIICRSIIDAICLNFDDVSAAIIVTKRIPALTTVLECISIVTIAASTVECRRRICNFLLSTTNLSVVAI